MSSSLRVWRQCHRHRREIYVSCSPACIPIRALEMHHELAELLGKVRAELYLLCPLVKSSVINGRGLANVNEMGGGTMLKSNKFKLTWIHLCNRGANLE